MIQASEKQIEAGAMQAYMNNREGTVEWCDVPEKHKKVWRWRARSVIEAALNECYIPAHPL